MAANDLTTLASAQAWIPSLDATTGARLITTASTSIQKWLGYQIASASYTRTFNGRGNTRIFVPDVPITAVTSVAVGAMSIPAGTSTTSGYFFDAASIMLSGYAFACGVQNVAISYAAGYATTPDDVEQACLDFIAMILDRKVRVADAAALSAASGSVKYDDLSRAPMVLPAPIRALLQPYVRVSLGA